MQKSRLVHRTFLPIVASFIMIVYLAGCGSDKTNGAVEPASSPDSAATVESSASPSPSSAPAASPEAAETNIVQKGQVPIEGQPAKIAITDFRFADSLLALGIKPHAMASYLGSTRLDWLDDAALQDVMNLGDDGNEEAVLESEPDLIIAWENQANRYDNYSKIAPTLVVGESPDWKTDFRQFADIFGKRAEAEQFLRQYDEKAAAGKLQLASALPANATALSMRIVGKEYRIHSDDQKLGRILYQDLGFQVPEKVKPIQRRETISLEALPQFDADYVFIEIGAPRVGGDKEAEQKFAELEQSSVWKNLTAVKNNHVVVVPYWTDLDFPQVDLHAIDLVVDGVLNPETA